MVCISFGICYFVECSVDVIVDVIFFLSRAEAKLTTGSSKKPKAVSKLSHDLFGSGSFDEEDSGDLFSPTETAKDLSTAAPTVKTATPTTSAAKKGGGKKAILGESCSGVLFLTVNSFIREGGGGGGGGRGQWATQTRSKGRGSPSVQPQSMKDL